MEKERRPSVVPEGILSLAEHRQIVAKDPYFKTPGGQILTFEGLLRERSDPRRIDKEKQMISDYLNVTDQQEKDFINIALDDPNSDTKIELHLFGVEKVNIRRFKPMDPECRAAVIVPARFEEERIGDLLEGYKNQQGVDFRQFEINILVNHRIDETPDSTSQVVLDFMRKNPEMRINLIDLQFDRQHAKVGVARKLVTDIILSRTMQRSEYSSAFYLITEDADVNKIDPTIVRKTIETFDNNPQLDSLRGRQDRSNALIAQNHLCVLKYKAGQIAEVIARDKKLRDSQRPGFNFEWNRIVSGGWGCSFTAESYTLIGGYPEATLGEDIAIGQLISLARGSKDKHNNIVPFTDTNETFAVRQESNFLRFATEMLTGLPAYREDQFDNQDPKKMNELELVSKLRKYNRLNPDNEENLRQFEDVLTGAILFLRYTVNNDKYFIEYSAPLLLWGLGFKKSDYEFFTDTEGNLQLQINNWWNLYSCLEKNRKKYEDEFHKRYI